MKCNSSIKNNRWQNELVDAVTDPKELLQLLNLDLSLLPAAEKAARIFPLKVPRQFVKQIEKGNVNDPLLKQILPIQSELDDVPGYTRDPLQEAAANPVPGLLHKYHSRVLLTFTGSCAINCRYCFRRFFDYEENNPGTAGWQKALDYIAQDASISEVILSGGDPLVAPDQTIKKLVENLTHIEHIKRLRIHSRIPIVLPERITPELIQLLTNTRLKKILVVHCNHAREIHGGVKEAMRVLKQADVTLLNQTVLLKGVNDNADTLVELSEALFDAGIQPYYLHALDKVEGAAHFDLSRSTAQQLYGELSKRLSGYLVPKLVCEQPNAPGKLLINSGDFCTV